MPHSDQQSFTTTNQNLALQQSLLLLEQKSLIVEKYMQRISLLQSKIEQLMVEIERLNWENREKEYSEQYVRRVNVKSLIKEGFVEEVSGVNGEDNANNNNNSNTHGTENCQTNKNLIIRIMLSPNTQQVLLTQNMHLIKDNHQQTFTSSSSPQSLHQMHTSQSSQSSIQSYCQSVLTQVEQMKLQLSQDREDGLRKLVQLEEENKALLLSRNKLQELLEEGRFVYQAEALLRGKELEDAKRQRELRERDVDVLRKEIEEIRKKHEEEIVKKDELMNEMNDQLIKLQQLQSQIEKSQFQTTTHLTQMQSLNQQLQSLTTNHTLLTTNHTLLTTQHTQTLTQLSQQSTLITHLQQTVSQLSSQLLTQQQQNTNLQNLISTKQPTIRIINNTDSKSTQTDAELIFDVNFLRHTRQQLTPAGIQQHKICLPPSLDMIGFDFDNSMSSHNVSNLSVNYNNNKNQIYSNLSSSSFSKNDRHMDEMHTTNIVKVHQEKKTSSQQKIQVPQQDHDKPINILDLSPNQLKQIKLRPKVASYSQKNIIIQQPNQDQDHNQFKKKSNKNILLHVHNPYNHHKPTKSEHSQQLIQSRSALSQTESEPQHMDQNDEFADPIYDREPDLGDSDHPSQTYKNSLVLPNRNESSVDSERVNWEGNYHDSYELSKSLPFKGYKVKSPGGRQYASKASELLDLKSPQNIMKSLIEKSFPIEKNPFKLSNQYLNVGEIIKEQNRSANESSFTQKIKSSNQGSDSLVNIMIQSQDGQDLQKIDEVKNSNIERENTLYLTPGTRKESEKKDQQKSNNIQSANKEKSIDFITPQKKEPIDLAESLDFASLKLIEKENNQNSKSKKKHKVIFLRR